MIRRCKNSCPLQLECSWVKEEISSLLVQVENSGQVVMEFLDEAGEALKEVNELDPVERADLDEQVLRLIDRNLDTFNKDKEYFDKLQQLQDRSIASSILSKLAVATCIGTVRGRCSSPFGLLHAYLERKMIDP